MYLTNRPSKNLAHILALSILVFGGLVVRLITMTDYKRWNVKDDEQSLSISKSNKVEKSDKNDKKLVDENAQLNKLSNNLGETTSNVSQKDPIKT